MTAIRANMDTAERREVIKGIRVCVAVVGGGHRWWFAVIIDGGWRSSSPNTVDIGRKAR